MRRIGDEDFLSRNSLRVVIRPHNQQAGELSMGTGRRLERDCVHAGDFGEAVAQRLDDPQCTLRNFLGLIRMPVCQTVKTRNNFIHAGVVFHGARPERIHSEVNGIVPGGKPSEVANDFDLADLGHVAEVRACR